MSESMFCDMCNSKEINRLNAEFSAKSCNEKLARSLVSAMAVQLDPTIDELSDIVTAVSEAVTNCIIHGYGKIKKKKEACIIKFECILYENAIEVGITDEGCGIEDIEKAREPLYTSSPEMERSGMGFTIMESFCDGFSVQSIVGEGTEIRLFKIFGGDNLCENTTIPQ
mgnify:CR=1 FL=1